ncbi:hypothetical protein BSL78_17272 [Apostichopus japonicus]|uniref:Alpha-(1,6)-fucosyltransferase N- and catalytic domain-containing protein n=1 Tax=Stichopus japonicus TaxID=307972 RepID=A0A2G8KD20_STIJA|nr:hypothetical protein BSL78_17272 [Apostichopus japonicus]
MPPPKMKFTVQLSLIIGILWLGSLVFLTVTFSPASDRGPSNLPDLRQISENLNRVGYQTEELKRYTKELRDILELQLKKDDNPDNRILLEKLEKRDLEEEDRAIKSTQCSEPRREYEHIRRKTSDGVIELWYYMTSQLKNLKKQLDKDQKGLIENILDNGSHQQSLALFIPGKKCDFRVSHDLQSDQSCLPYLTPVNTIYSHGKSDFSRSTVRYSAQGRRFGYFVDHGILGKLLFSSGARANRTEIVMHAVVLQLFKAINERTIVSLQRYRRVKVLRNRMILIADTAAVSERDLEQRR